MPAFISVDYDEPKPSTYRGVHLRVGDTKKYVFATGNPTVDYFTAACVAQFHFGDDAPVMHSSTVDHFVMDGGTLRDQEPTEEDIEQAVSNAKSLRDRGGLK